MDDPVQKLDAGVKIDVVEFLDAMAREKRNEHANVERVNQAGGESE